jgi:hypothetical protein
MFTEHAPDTVEGARVMGYNDNDFDFSKEIDIKIDFNLDSYVDIDLYKDVDIDVDVKSDVDIEGNFASATFSVEAIGWATFAEADVHVLAIENELSSVDGVLVAAVG